MSRFPNAFFVYLQRIYFSWKEKVGYRRVSASSWQLRCNSAATPLLLRSFPHSEGSCKGGIREDEGRTIRDDTELLFGNRPFFPYFYSDFSMMLFALSTMEVSSEARYMCVVFSESSFPGMEEARNFALTLSLSFG